MILAEERELRRDVEMMKNYEFGEVHFGTGPLPAAGILVPILKEMIENYPKLCIRVEVANIGLSTGTPASGEARIRDCRYPRDHDSPIFAVTPLPQLRLSCYCRAGHPLLSKEGSRHYGPGELSTGFGDPSTIGFWSKQPAS